NNYPDDVVSGAGTSKCGVDKIGAIVTRGVLLDMASFKGRHHLGAGEVITAEDMIQCAQWEDIKFEAGDAILIRTNYLSQFNPQKPKGYFDGCPGIGLSTVDLLDRNGAVAIGADTAYVEVHPPEVKGEGVPVHE